MIERLQAQNKRLKGEVEKLRVIMQDINEKQKEELKQKKLNIKMLKEGKRPKEPETEESSHKWCIC